MQLRLTPEPPSCLRDYACIPIAFNVTERLDFPRDERVPVAPPYVKDYDAQPGQHPTRWPHRFDLTRWIVAAAYVGAAYVGEARVGGAAIILDARDVEPYFATPDDALLWDIRVHPGFRRQGVGRALLAFAELHARAAGRGRMIVETQDINVRACRLYAHAGYVLTRVNPRAYADFPDEVQLIWQKDLATTA